MNLNLENKTVTIYVQLLEEGSSAARPTQAIDLGDGLFKVLPIPNFDSADEVWEFPPGSVVRCIKENDGKEDYLFAVKP